MPLWPGKVWIVRMVANISLPRAFDVDSGLAAQEMPAQHLARRLPFLQIEGIDDRYPEPARRHGVALRRLVLVEGDLHARHTRHGRHLPHQNRRRMTITPTPRPAQHNAEPVPAIVVRKAPNAIAIETDKGLGPARAVKI